MNANWLRKLVSDEFRETLMWSGLTDDYHCKTKVADGRTIYYKFDTKLGECRVYSHKKIQLGNQTATSMTMAKRMLEKYCY